MATLRSARRLLFPRPVHALVALLVCVVVPTALVVRQISENVNTGPYDEVAHWDYVVRLGQGELPRLGDPFLPSTNRESMCRFALATKSPEPAGCDRNVPAAIDTPVPIDLQGHPVSQYEAQHPPGHYALVLPFRWIGMKLFGVSDFTASRLSGAAFLAIGLCLLWAAGRLLRVPPWPLASGILLLGSAPDPIFLASFVSNDATAVMAGSLVILAGVLAWRRPGFASTVIAAAVGAGVASLKLSNLLPVGAVSLTLAVLTWEATRDEQSRRVVVALRRWARGGGALLGGAVVFAVVWTVLWRARQVIEPRDLRVLDILRGVPVDTARVLRSGSELFNPWAGSAQSPGTLGTDAQTLLRTLLVLVAGAGALSGLYVSVRKWHHWLGLSSIASILVGGIVLGLGLHLTFDIDPVLPARYALPMTPLLMLATVAGLRGKGAQAAVGALAVVSAVTTLLVLYVS